MFYNKKIFDRCFNYRKKYWYRNFKEIPLYFRLMHHLTKHGYDEYAEWETFSWFIETMRSILREYRKNHESFPVVIDGYDYGSEDIDKAGEVWESIIDRMISLLDNMDECNPKYEKVSDKEKWEMMHDAKDRFFDLFSKYFYHLWD